jgi:hypothetical protein
MAKAIGIKEEYETFYGIYSRICSCFGVVRLAKKR